MADHYPDSDYIGRAEANYGEYGPRQFHDNQDNAFRGNRSESSNEYDHGSLNKVYRDSVRDRKRQRRRSRSRSRTRSRSRSRDRRRKNRSRSRSRDRTGNRNDRHRSYNNKGDKSHDRGSRSRNRDEYSMMEGRLPQQPAVGFEQSKRTSGNDWRSKLTSIRDAHFNRHKQAPSIVQNTFKNDGSFLEMFKKKMAGQGEDASSSVTPNSLVLASSSIPYGDGLSLPPLTAMPVQEPQSSSSSTIDDQDVDGVPMATHKPLPMPVSVGKRRLAKPLKTGIVFKKPPEPAEDEASQEKLDAWSRYLQEVQKYKSANCMDEDVSRPLVK